MLPKTSHEVVIVRCLLVIQHSSDLCFRHVCKIAKSHLTSACQLVRVEPLGPYWTDFQEI